MTKLSLGQAARAAGMSKSTLQRMLASGRMSGTQRADSVWEIDMSEVQRVLDARDAPQRGRKAAPVEDKPVEAARPEAVELAELRAHLANVRDRLDEAIRREQAAEARAAEALAREREMSDRVARLIEDKRPAAGGGFLARLFGSR